MSVLKDDISQEVDTFIIKRNQKIEGGYELSYYREKLGVVLSTGSKSIPIDVKSEQGLELLGMIYERLTHLEKDGVSKEIGFREQQNGNPSKPNSSFELVSSDGSARVVLDSENDLDMLMNARKNKEAMVQTAKNNEIPKTR